PADEGDRAKPSRHVPGLSLPMARRRVRAQASRHMSGIHVVPWPGPLLRHGVALAAGRLLRVTGPLEAVAPRSRSPRPAARSLVPRAPVDPGPGDTRRATVRVHRQPTRPCTPRATRHDRVSQLTLVARSARPVGLGQSMLSKNPRRRLKLAAPVAI